jgi:hypothetical protein
MLDTCPSPAQPPALIVLSGCQADSDSRSCDEEEPMQRDGRSRMSGDSVERRHHGVYKKRKPVCLLELPCHVAKILLHRKAIPE